MWYIERNAPPLQLLSLQQEDELLYWIILSTPEIIFLQSLNLKELLYMHFTFKEDK